MKEQVNKVMQHYRMKRLIEHMVGPIGSIIFHILIVVVAVKFMIFDQADKPAEIEVMIMEADAQKLEEFEKELEQLDVLPDVTDAMMPPDDVQMNVEAPSEAPGPVSEDVTTDLAALNVMSDVQSPLIMKGLYAGRSSGGRATALGQYGGKWGAYTEASVVKALEWLKANQKPDGSWEPKSDAPAMTGLALLAFLAHGETTSSEKYGPTVEKAIRFLVSVQKPGGEMTEINQHGVYEHAIASYAVSEAYGLTRIPSLKPVMEKATAVILAGQQSGGSWDYHYKKEGRADLSVAGWQIQALKSALMSGAENPGLKEAIEKAVECVKTFQNPEHGLFGYTDNKVGASMRPSMTGVAVLCLQIGGQADSPEARKGLNALQSADCDWNQPTEWPMYAWYYITQAKYHRGGSEWQAWNNDFAREFTKNQNADGSWNTPSKTHETAQGPVYSTALAALTLQVYYRFLPSYKPIVVEPAGGKQSDDISIDIM